MTIPAPPAKVHHRKMLEDTPQIHKASNCWSTKHRGRTGRRNLLDVGCLRYVHDMFIINMFYHAFFKWHLYTFNIHFIESTPVLTLHPNPTSRGNSTFLAWDRYRPHQALVIHGASALFVEIKFGHFCKVQVRYQSTYTVTRLYQPISVCSAFPIILTKQSRDESAVCKTGPMLRHICQSGAWTNKRRMTKPQCRDNRHTVSAYAGTGEPSFKD